MITKLLKDPAPDTRPTPRSALARHNKSFRLRGSRYDPEGAKSVRSVRCPDAAAQETFVAP
jgi:hypothetical protein